MTATKPKKIIFINRYFYPDHSATSQLLTDVAFELASDHKVHLITSAQRYDDPSVKLLPFETIDKVHIHRIWTSRFGRQRLLGRTADYLSFYLTAAWQLWHLAAPNDIIVAKTDPPLISVIAYQIAKWRKATLVNWLQDLFPEVAAALGVYGIKGKPLRWLQAIRNKSLQGAKTNVVLGDLMANQLHQLGITQDKIAVIHNWADGKSIQPIVPTHNLLRLEWYLADKFVVGYSGNMGRAHEFMTLLATAEHLRAEKNITFLLIGDGPQRLWIEREVVKRSLENVMFRPYQPREKLGESLTVPDVHLISLRPALEGLIVPSKFYGIAAAGRPILYIGDKQGEIPQILSKHKCGITVPDSIELAKHIKQFADNPKLCQQMGMQARQTFERLFDKPLALSRWKSVLLGE